MTDRGFSTSIEGGKTSLIVKAGSNILLPKEGGIDVTCITDQIADVRREAHTILVTSGAAGAGEWHLRSVGIEAPCDMDPSEWKKLCSGIGQPRVVKAYEEAFEHHTISPLIIAQVLLTEADLRASQDLHALIRLLNNYLVLGILPIVNGNDPACAADLMPLDNDDLMCRIAYLMRTAVRINLTNTDGVMDRHGNSIETISCDSTTWESEMDDTKSPNGTGGMKPKVRTAIDLVRKDGIPFHIANGRKPNIIEDILYGRKDAGNMWTTIRP